DQRGNRECDNRQRPIRDVADYLRETDHAYVDTDVRAFDALANFLFQFVRNTNGIDGPTVRVFFQHDGAHERAREVVRNKSSNDTRLQYVLAHLRKARRRGLEVCGNDVARLYAVLDN